jgi:hypothetical protein
MDIFYTKLTLVSTNWQHKKASASARFFRYVFSLSVLYHVVTLSEEQRYAPKGAKSYYRKDNSCGQGCSAAAYPGNNVKTEESYTAPVDSADDE